MDLAEHGSRASREASAGTAAGPLRLLVDLNIVLDVVLKRDPWYHDAVTLLNGSLLGVGGGACGTPAALPNVYFLPDQ